MSDVSDVVEPEVHASTSPKGAPRDISDTPLLGGRYRLIRRLGKGGMGEVFLAQHATIEKHVAIKILLPERAKEETQKARFLNEAKATAKVSHPNVIDISDFGETDDGRAFFVMEYLAGEDLKRYGRRVHIAPWSDIEQILLQVCSGLGAAHEQGIVHRDLKPDNIFLIEHQGIKNFVKVLDFGLAKMLHDDSAKKLTKTGIIVGTPAFLSPEQIKGDAVDHRADIYALGLIIYRLLCGRLPFKAKNVVEMLRKQLRDTPLPPSAMAPDAPISPAADQIALKALAKRADDRFQSTQELGEAIADVKRHPGGVQIAVPGAGASSDAGGSSGKPRLEILTDDVPVEGEIVVPLKGEEGGKASSRRDPTGPDPSASFEKPSFQRRDPGDRDDGVDDGVITPASASARFRSQLLSRPDEVGAALRRADRADRADRGVPLGVVVVIVVLFVGVVAALWVLR